MNILAVGASLAAITGVVFSLLFHERSVIPLVTALPTLAFGSLWAIALRWEKTVPQTNLRWGWLASVALASLNGSSAVGLLFAFERNASGWSDRIASFFRGLFLGATVGAIAWVPALLVTLVVFGLPIAWAQNQAKKGLSGQERGEGIVGGASALIALTSLLLSIPVDALRGDSSLHIDIVRLLAVAASVLGAAAMYTARARDQERQKFVAAVERGEVEHFRVDATDEGKVLVRVVSQGQGYRVRDYEEEIAALDEDGAVKRGVRVEPT
jgi:hypothetical protein